MTYFLVVDNFDTRAIFDTYPQARDYSLDQARCYYRFAPEFYREVPIYVIRIYKVTSNHKSFYPNHMKLIEVL